MSGFDELDYAPKGPKTEDIQEERLKKLANKGKVDRTEEYLQALKVIKEICSI